MIRFPKRSLRRLRRQAIEAAHEVTISENSWGVRNIEKQYAAIDGLRRRVQDAEKSIGGDRVKFILTHSVPQIRSLLDLTSPRPGEQGRLLPNQYVDAVLANIDREIESIATSRWRSLGIPGILVALVGVIGAVAKFGQFLEPSHLINTNSPSPSAIPAFSKPSPSSSGKGQGTVDTSVTPSPTYTPVATRIPTPVPTTTPAPTATSTPTATATPTPAQTPTPTPTPIPTPPPKAPPRRLDSTEGTAKPQPKKVSRFKLGPISIDVDGVKNARSDLQVYVTITNQSDRVVYVFAGSPNPIGASWRQMANGAQALTGRGSDNQTSTFWLKSVDGFTRTPEKYFRGENIYTELAPAESTSASFLLANNWLTGPQLGNTVNVSIEFAIVTDLRAKGTHQTKALTLTNWPLD